MKLEINVKAVLCVRAATKLCSVKQKSFQYFIFIRMQVTGDKWLSFNIKAMLIATFIDAGWIQLT